MSAQASAKVKNEVQEVKDKAQKIVDEIDSEKVKAETKLEAAKPALEEAEAALNVSPPACACSVSISLCVYLPSRLSPLPLTHICPPSLQHPSSSLPLPFPFPPFSFSAQILPGARFLYVQLTLDLCNQEAELHSQPRF